MSTIDSDVLKAGHPTTVEPDAATPQRGFVEDFSDERMKVLMTQVPEGSAGDLDDTGGSAAARVSEALAGPGKGNRRTVLRLRPTRTHRCNTLFSFHGPTGSELAQQQDGWCGGLVKISS